MKYILTEAQYSRLVESDLSYLKKLMFKYWDSHKEKMNSTFYKLFDISQWASEDQVQEFYLEWLGGIGKVYELMKNAEGDTKVARGGTYNFRFKILNVEMGNENTEVFYDALVDRDGDVEIEIDSMGEPDVINNIYDAITNPDIGWEVKDEIVEIIKQEVKDEVVDYPCNLSEIIIGNRKDF